MIVVDASALTELLANERDLSDVVRERMGNDHEWFAPEHLTIETANALRGLWLAGRSTDDQFYKQLHLLGAMRFNTAPSRLVLARIRALAANATAYDAAYLALAEHLDAPLLTLDAKLARVPDVTARVDVVR